MVTFLKLAFYIYLYGNLFQYIKHLNQDFNQGKNLKQVFLGESTQSLKKLFIATIISQIISFISGIVFQLSLYPIILIILSCWLLISCLFILENILGYQMNSKSYYTIQIFISICLLIAYTDNQYPFSLFNIMDDIRVITLLVIGTAVISGLFNKITGNHSKPSKIKKNKTKSKDKLRPERLKLYQEAGLSDQEIDHFRQQMQTSRDQIKSIEQELAKNAKTRAIEANYHLIDILKNYFKDIVNQPQRRLLAGNFLINLLPQLEDILKKYNEINRHVAKNKESYLILEKSAQVIDRLAQEITDDYLQFHAKTYQDLADDLALAEKTLNQRI